MALAAPGCNIAPALDGGYSDFCGTSSATPIVAGLAALAMSAAPAATSAEIVAALEKGSMPIDGHVRYGDVQAAETLTALGVRLPTRVLTTRLTGRLTLVRRLRRLAGRLGLLGLLGLAVGHEILPVLLPSSLANRTAFSKS